MPSNRGEWPEWPRPRRGKIPRSFAAYEDRLKRILGRSGARSKVHRLPPVPRQLAREGHQTKEFRTLAADLFHSAALPEFEPDPRQILATLLFRSGYYHALTVRQSTREIRQRVVNKIQYGQRERSYLWLLGGCNFARSFKIFGLSVEPVSLQQLEQMSPEPHTGFMAEMEQQRRWFLVKRELEILPDGWIGKGEWERLESSREREPDIELEELRRKTDYILAKLEPRTKETH